LLKALNLKCNHYGKTGHNKTNYWELNPDKHPKYWISAAANTIDGSKTLSKSNKKLSGKEDAQDLLESCMLSIQTIST
jgi:hypothetical protein